MEQVGRTFRIHFLYYLKVMNQNVVVCALGISAQLLKTQ